MVKNKTRFFHPGLNTILIYSFFAFLFLLWILKTYRNEVHMDMLNIIDLKIKNLFEHRLQLTDFIYQPLFPTLTSLCFTFINARFFHLNTVIEIAAGAIFLIIVGYKYVKELTACLLTNRSRISFTLLSTFIIFGLHKWEASFTPFFSFAVFFDLCICFFSYFFILKYISPGYAGKAIHVGLFTFFNILVILEAPAYFFSYILAALAILLLIKRFNLTEISRKRWQNILYLSLLLLLLAVGLVIYLSNVHPFSYYTSNLGIADFLGTFLKKPLWFIKFYLIAHSGPFIGEAVNYLELRTWIGLTILFAYALAARYVIVKKDKRLIIPLALIFYNIFSYAFIAVGKYSFNALEYGASSRYTAHNLSGVMGLTTILFFYISDQKSRITYTAGWVFMIMILTGYLLVDIRQYKISPYRTQAFKNIEMSLLSGKNLKSVHPDTSKVLRAIAVLKKYKLNVFYGHEKQAGDSNLNLAKSGKIILTPGTPEFDKLQKIGIYNYEEDNRFAWTNGNASIHFNHSIETPDSLIVQVNTHMPPACKNVTPNISIVDENNTTYSPLYLNRNGDRFVYKFYFKQPSRIQRINIISDTIKAAPPDIRKLSFPLISLELNR